MATVTKPKKSRVEGRGSRAKPNGQSTRAIAPPLGDPSQWREALAGSGSQLQAPSTQLLDVDLIEPSPFQPRREFDEAELARMAAEIGADGRGLIHAIRVRPRGNGYELIAGERRLRAAKLAGCRTIRAEVGEMSDEEAADTVLRENLSRAALNPIELAGYLKARRARTGESQAALGKRFGHDQGWVSDHERLLELPAAVQALVISREMPRTVARHLAPLAGYPEICTLAAKDVARDCKDGATPGADDVKRSLHAALRQKGREIGGYHEKFGYVRKLKLSDAQRAQLGVVSVDGWGGKTEYATNRAAYDQLVAEHVERQREREDKRDKAAASKAKQAAKDPAKAKEAAAKFAKRLWSFYVDWARYAIAKELRSGHVSYEIRLLLVVEAAATWEHKRWTPDGTERFAAQEILCRLIGDAGGKVPRRNGQEDLGRGLETVAEAEVETLAERYLAAYFCQDDCPCGIVPEDRVLRIADWLYIDLGVLWADEQCGPLSEQYWGLHTKEQLEELGRELNVSLDGAAKRADMIQRFLDYQPAEDDDANTAAAKALPLPKELRKPARPK